MIRQRVKLKRFVLAKIEQNTLNSRSQFNYYKNFEKALIFSLLAIIFGFRIAANINFEKYLSRENDINIELIDIAEIPPVIEPPPQLKMEEIIEIKPEKEKTEEEILSEEIEDMLGENEDKVELSLNSDDLALNLISTSALGSVAGPELNMRDYDNGNDNGLSLRNRKLSGDINHSNLDIGQVELGNKKLISDNASIDLKAETEDIKTTDEQEDEVKLGISGFPEKILSISSSTIGTDDYKIWNKINSELDRLHKGRYGAIPKEIEQKRGGFLITFSFSDGASQEVHWRNNGNVFIKVIGKSTKSTVQELQRTLQGLVKLTLSN